MSALGAWGNGVIGLLLWNFKSSSLIRGDVSLAAPSPTDGVMKIKVLGNAPVCGTRNAWTAAPWCQIPHHTHLFGLTMEASNVRDARRRARLTSLWPCLAAAFAFLFFLFFVVWMKEIPGLQTASLESFLFSLSKLLFLDFLVAGEAVTCARARTRTRQTFSSLSHFAVLPFSLPPRRRSSPRPSKSSQRGVPSPR